MPGIEDLREKREEVGKQIREEEGEKAKIQQDLQILTKRLAHINDSLARKVSGVDVNGRPSECTLVFTAESVLCPEQQVLWWFSEQISMSCPQETPTLFSFSFVLFSSYQLYWLRIYDGTMRRF